MDVKMLAPDWYQAEIHDFIHMSYFLTKNVEKYEISKEI
jgi:hypothetical protein